MNAVLRTAQKTEYEILQATKLSDTFCDTEDQLHARLTSNEGLYQLITPYFEDAVTRQASGSNIGNGLTATGWSYNMLSSFCEDCPVSSIDRFHCYCVMILHSSVNQKQYISTISVSTCQLIDLQMRSSSPRMLLVDCLSVSRYQTSSFASWNPQTQIWSIQAVKIMRQLVR